ncbi:MAG: hypothetical protein HC819_14775 [Cyclobacteriaceae bacterium]|nr:hypothetical protein [Cyclobacteriaceae bacterium]
MKIYTAVQTEEKAIINEHVSDNSLAGGLFKKTSCRCECGETQCITWYNGDVSIIVAICDACGDDNAFKSDVLNQTK